jgi:hypothetical protein
MIVSDRRAAEVPGAVLRVACRDRGEVVDEALDVGAADVSDPHAAEVRHDVGPHRPRVRLAGRGRQATRGAAAVLDQPALDVVLEVLAAGRDIAG